MRIIGFISGTGETSYGGKSIAADYEITVSQDQEGAESAAGSLFAEPMVLAEMMSAGDVELTLETGETVVVVIKPDSTGSSAEIVVNGPVPQI